MDKKIQKINSEHKNEMEGIKQNFKILIDENIKQLKDDNVRKDEKINSLKVEIKKLHNLGDDLIKLQSNFNNLELKFNVEKEKNVSLENELKEMDKKIQKINDEIIKVIINESVRKDEQINSLEVKIKKLKINGNNNCINTDKPSGNCIKENGYVNLINDESIKYLVAKGGCDKFVSVYAENSFKNPQNPINFSLYYFEVKCIFEKELNDSSSYMEIGLRNCRTFKSIYYSATYAKIYNEKGRSFKLPTFSLNNNDIFVCGLVYPPTNKLNEFPYVFFTQNGKQIGKCVLLNDNFDSYKPFVQLKCCSLEANFGNDLKTKPFNYDASEHTIHKEFF
uniref:Uncharacterized protein n=1 Tax=Meloidogyne enterolobii TaxID=390850 RepID=A0A6V7XL99_MELEN|nr:unnamed protein product [Meloidogyne enterolobii]